MSVLSVSVRAHLMVCPDGYEVQGRQRVKSGIADLMDKSRKVVAPKSTANEERVVDDLSAIWRLLIQIHNLALVARDATIHRQVTNFCDLYGLPEAIDSASGRSPSTVLLSNVLVEASRMSKAIAECQQDFIEVPSDVQAAFDVAMGNGISAQGRLVALKLNNIFLAGWFGLANSLVSKSSADWGSCDFCGGLRFTRAGSRFCSDYCRDRNKKKTARAK
ncbi:MAG: hypothetical protein O3C15_12020 [Proteobacteria bacterium]|nr:hypothetical protein [Pseudomonadota bacterium]